MGTDNGGAGGADRPAWPRPALIRVGLVDDHPIIVGGIEAAISTESDIAIVATAGSAIAAEHLLDRQDLAVLLLDVRLPDGNGLEVLARARRDSGPAVIILSSFESRQYVAAAVRFGASGFMLKTTPTHELVEAIRRVAAGGTAFAAPGLGAASYLALSGRERDLIRMVIEARSNGEIAGVLRVRRKTVEAQLTRLYEKIGVASRVELAIRAEREGWLDLDPARPTGLAASGRGPPC